MLAKFVLAAVLCVGVLGRTVPEENSWLNSIVAADYCEQDKIQQVQSSMSTFKQCLNEMMTDNSFQLEMRQIVLSNYSSRTVKAFCDKSSQMKTCLRTLFTSTSLTPCFTANGLRRTQKEMISSLDFFCANDGAKMVLFFKEDGIECYRDASFSVASCTSTKTSAITRLIDAYGTGPAIPERERCKIDKRADACTVAAVKTCSNPVPGKLFEELQNSLDTNCDDENQDTVGRSTTESPAIAVE